MRFYSGDGELKEKRKKVEGEKNRRGGGERGREGKRGTLISIYTCLHHTKQFS